MATEDKGIRALFPDVVLPEEIEQKREAKEYIKRKLGVVEKTPLLAAEDMNYLSSNLHKPIIEKLPAEQKDEFGFTPSQNREIDAYLTRDKGDATAWEKHKKSEKLAQKETPKQTWDRLDGNEKRRQKQLLRSWGLDKDPSIKTEYKKLVDFGIDNSSVKYTGSRQPLYDQFDKAAQNKKKFFKGPIQIDPKHPDGFRLTNDEDLYKHYGDTPVRYIQEIMYKYEDNAKPPVDGVIKKYDNQDPESFPSKQKLALDKYQRIYNRLNPMQKKQLAAIQRKK